MKPLNLPADYHPFKMIRIGENYFENAQSLVTIGGHAPLLIGKGEVPRVCLSVPGKQSGGDWFELIVANPSPPAVLSVDSHRSINELILMRLRYLQTKAEPAWERRS